MSFVKGFQTMERTKIIIVCSSIEVGKFSVHVWDTIDIIKLLISTFFHCNEYVITKQDQCFCQSNK